jgi:hypothetical protein
LILWSRSSFLNQESSIKSDSQFFLVISYRFAYVCGASNQLCGWLRLPKLTLSYLLLLRKDTPAATRSKESSNRRRVTKLAYSVFALGHVFACIWFYLGAQYSVTAVLSLSTLEMMSCDTFYIEWPVLVSWTRNQLVCSRRRLRKIFIFKTQ